MVVKDDTKDGPVTLARPAVTLVGRLVEVDATGLVLQVNGRQVPVRIPAGAIASVEERLSDPRSRGVRMGRGAGRGFLIGAGLGAGAIAGVPSHYTWQQTSLRRLNPAATPSAASGRSRAVALSFRF